MQAAYSSSKLHKLSASFAHLNQGIRHAPQQAAGAAADHAQPIHLCYKRNSALAGPLQPISIRPHQQQQALPAQRNSIHTAPGNAGRRDAAAAVELAQLLAEVCRTGESGDDSSSVVLSAGGITLRSKSRLCASASRGASSRRPCAPLERLVHRYDQNSWF